MKKKKLLAGGLGLLVCFALGGCASPPLQEDHFALDTLLSVTLYDTQDPVLLQECWEKVDGLEKRLSRTLPDSDIARINGSGGQAVEVSPETASLIGTALGIGAASGGALDITIGAVSSLWDFKAATPVLPGEKALSAARSTVDQRRVVLEENRVQVPAGTMLDLGAIAKGYVGDALAALLAERGCSCALLNLGGNIVTLGTKPDGTPWVIGIRDPLGTASQAAYSLDVEGGRAVVTSGIYERSFTLDGKLYHHLLDPATGYPAENELASVTVIAPSSTLADGLSTACFVLGPEKGLALLERYTDAEGVFLLRDGSCRTTAGIAGKLHKLENP